MVVCTQVLVCTVVLALIWMSRFTVFGHRIDKNTNGDVFPFQGPFQGPFFPVSFFNLNQDSEASDFAFERYNFDSFESARLGGPNWEGSNSKGNGERLKKNIQQYENDNIGVLHIADYLGAPIDTAIKQAIPEDFLDSSNDPENIAILSNIDPIIEDNSVKMAIEYNIASDDDPIKAFEDNITFEDDTFLPFLGEINENKETDQRSCRCICDEFDPTSTSSNKNHPTTTLNVEHHHKPTPSYKHHPTPIPKSAPKIKTIYKSETKYFTGDRISTDHRLGNSNGGNISENSSMNANNTTERYKTLKNYIAMDAKEEIGDNNGMYAHNEIDEYNGIGDYKEFDGQKESDEYTRMNSYEVLEKYNGIDAHNTINTNDGVHDYNRLDIYNEFHGYNTIDEYNAAGIQEQDNEATFLYRSTKSTYPPMIPAGNPATTNPTTPNPTIMVPTISSSSEQHISIPRLSYMSRPGHGKQLKTPKLSNERKMKTHNSSKIRQMKTPKLAVQQMETRKPSNVKFIKTAMPYTRTKYDQYDQYVAPRPYSLYHNMDTLDTGYKESLNMKSVNVAFVTYADTSEQADMSHPTQSSYETTSMSSNPIKDNSLSYQALYELGEVDDSFDEFSGSSLHESYNSDSGSRKNQHSERNEPKKSSFYSNTPTSSYTEVARDTIREVTHSKPPTKPGAEITISIFQSEDVLAEQPQSHIAQSNHHVSSKPLYVLNRQVETYNSQAEEGQNTGRSSFSMHLAYVDGQPSDNMETTLPASQYVDDFSVSNEMPKALNSPSIAKNVHSTKNEDIHNNSNEPMKHSVQDGKYQVSEKPNQLIRSKSVEEIKGNTNIDSAFQYSPTETMILNNNNGHKTPKQDSVVIISKSPQYKIQNQNGLTIIKNPYIFDRSAIVKHTPTGTSSPQLKPKPINIVKNSKETTKQSNTIGTKRQPIPYNLTHPLWKTKKYIFNQQMDVPSESIPTFSQSDSLQQPVQTIQQMQSKKFKDLPEIETDKIRLSFNIPCARSARYDLRLGFKFCV